tara:strand:+ start:3703 stop:3960 length:258 start_codon:yes stop_codon:yes gene_type:complete
MNDFLNVLYMVAWIASGLGLVVLFSELVTVVETKTGRPARHAAMGLLLCILLAVLMMVGALDRVRVSTGADWDIDGTELPEVTDE